MGTDIHFVAQRKIDGKWQDIKSDEIDFDAKDSYDAKTGRWKVKPGGEFHWTGDRNYYLFAWLADVRNGYGFAGVKTFEPVKPLTSNRGFPEDFDYVEPQYNDDYERESGHYLGDHSFGWALFSEILTHPRTQRVQSGVIEPEAYEALKDGKNPEEWSGDISGRNIVTLDSGAYEQAKRHGELDASKKYYVRSSWTMPDGLDHFIGAVTELAAKYGGENVRLVFGFDS